MQLLILILKHKEQMTEVLRSLVNIGIKGGTMLEGKGMAQSLEKMEELPTFGILRHLSNEGLEGSHVMLLVVDDEQALRARQEIKKLVDLTVPNSGIMFSIPLTYVEGLK